jgi:hypothetical protein
LSAVPAIATASTRVDVPEDERQRLADEVAQLLATVV